MKLQIQTSPQALSVASTSGSVVLYNDGPDTAYLGTDGTVDPSRDLPVPPNMYVPWPTGVPSWIVSKGTSNIRVINTFEAPSFNASPRQQVLINVGGQISSSTPGAYISIHDKVECAAYQSLRIRFVSTLSFSMSGLGTSCFELRFDWYSTDDQYISSDTYSVGRAMQPGGPNKPVMLTIPVKGAQVVTKVVNSFTGNYITDFSLMGLTDLRPIQLTPSYSEFVGGGSTDTEIDCPIAAGGGGGAVITGKEWGEDWAQFTYSTLGDIAFHSKSRYLNVAFSFNAAPAAGSLTLFDLNTQRIVSANYAFDTTKTRQDFVLTVPRSRQSALHIVGAPATLATVTLTWFD